MGLLSKYLEKRRERIIKPYVWGNVLDIGCGPATASTYEKIKTYIGIDLNKKLIDSLRKKYPQHRFYSKDLEFDTLKLGKKVDCVIMAAVVEHLNSYNHLFKEIIKNLKKNGIILITTPTSFGHKMHRIVSSIGIVSYEAAEDHKTIFSKRTFFKIANKFKLKLIKYQQFELKGNQFIILKKTNF